MKADFNLSARRRTSSRNFLRLQVRARPPYSTYIHTCMHVQPRRPCYAVDELQHCEAERSRLEASSKDVRYALLHTYIHTYVRICIHSYIILSDQVSMAARKRENDGRLRREDTVSRGGTAYSTSFIHTYKYLFTLFVNIYYRPHTYTCIYYTHTHTYIRTHVHTHTYIYAHTYIYTHTTYPYSIIPR